MVDPIGGGFLLLLDSFKFHKLRRERAGRVLFLLTLLASLGPALLPYGKGMLYLSGNTDSDLVTRLLAASTRFDSTDTLWLVSFLVGPVLCMFFALLHSNLHVDDLMDRADGRPIRRTLFKLPRLVLFFLILEALVLFGGIFLFIPSLILIYATTLSPLLITVGDRRTVEAFMEGFAATNHFKLRIFFLEASLVLAMNLPVTLLAMPFASSDATGVATATIGAFFTAMSWMMRGRLHGTLYHLLVTKRNDMISSSEK